MKKYFLAVITGVMVMMMAGCSDTSVSEENVFSDLIVPQESNVDEPAAPQEADNQPVENDSESDTDEPSFYGTWTVKDYQAGEVTALSAEEMESFKGMTVTYQADAVMMNSQNIDLTDFDYEYETYTEQSFAEAYRVNLGEWWNEKEKVTGVTVTPSDGFFGSQFFAADENTIWISYEGVIFLAGKEA